MRKSLVAAVAGAAGVAAIAGGFAWATIPSSSGVIKACYQKNGGQLRVVDSSSLPHVGAPDPVEPDRVSGSRDRGLRGPRGRRAAGRSGPARPAGTARDPGPERCQRHLDAAGDRRPELPDWRLSARRRRWNDLRVRRRGRRARVFRRDRRPGPARPGRADRAVGLDARCSAVALVDPDGNQSDSSFSLELESGDALRVTSFAGCLPTSFDGRPSSCYFTVRGLPDSLDRSG